VTDQSSETPSRITLVVLDGCPNADVAVARLHEALSNCGREDLEVAVTVVESEEEGRLAGLQGSPTFLVDGRDPFPVGEGTSWACRLYPTDRGLEGCPSVTQLEEVLAP
jgi:hypothetical protein